MLSPMRARSSLLIGGVDLLDERDLDGAQRLVAAVGRGALRRAVRRRRAARRQGPWRPRRRPPSGGAAAMSSSTMRRSSSARGRPRRAARPPYRQVGGRDEWYSLGMTDAADTINVKLFAGLELRAASGARPTSSPPSRRAHRRAPSRVAGPRAGRRRDRARQRRARRATSRRSTPATRSRSSLPWGAGEPAARGESAARRCHPPGATAASGRAPFRVCHRRPALSAASLVCVGLGRRALLYSHT